MFKTIKVESNLELPYNLIDIQDGEIREKTEEVMNDIENDAEEKVEEVMNDIEEEVEEAKE